MESGNPALKQLGNPVTDQTSVVDQQRATLKFVGSSPRSGKKTVGVHLFRETAELRDVPSHDPPDLLRRPDAAVRDAVAAGLTEDQATEGVRLDAYSGWDNYEQWFPLNARGVYRWLAADGGR